MTNKILRHCSLTNDLHIMSRDDKVCETCDCNPHEITMDTLQEVVKFYTARVAALKVENAKLSNALSDMLALRLGEILGKAQADGIVAETRAILARGDTP